MTAASLAAALAAGPPAAGADAFLVALSVFVAVLIVLSACFALGTMGWHLRHAVVARHRERLERAWTPPVLEVLASGHGAAAVTGAVARGDRVHFADFLLRLAQRVRGPERAQVAALAAPVLDEVLAQLRSAKPEVRARGVIMLGMLAPGRHLAAIEAALDDPEPLVAVAAARTLARPEHPGQVAAILDRLPRFADWSSGFLASMLAAAGPEAAPALRQVLANGSAAARSRVAAAEALRVLRDLPSAEPAAAVVAAGGDTDLVTSALRLLGAVGSPAQAAVVRAAAGSANPVVRAQACAALGTLGDSRDAPRLGAALDDADAWVVLHAARSLRALGTALLEREAASRPRAAETVRQVLAE